MISGFLVVLTVTLHGYVVIVVSFTYGTGIYDFSVKSFLSIIAFGAFGAFSNHFSFSSAGAWSSDVARDVEIFSYFYGILNGLA